MFTVATAVQVHVASSVVCRKRMQRLYFHQVKTLRMPRFSWQAVCCVLLFSAYCSVATSIEEQQTHDFVISHDQVRTEKNSVSRAGQQPQSSSRRLKQSEETQAPVLGPLNNRTLDEAFVSTSGLYFQVSLRTACHSLTQLACVCFGGFGLTPARLQNFLACSEKE